MSADFSTLLAWLTRIRLTAHAASRFAVRLLMISALVLPFSTAARADLRAELRAPISEALQQVGAGRLHWLGFHIYDASTWAEQVPLPADGTLPTPFALQLVYARNISAQELVEATESAWADLGLLDSRARSWLPQLERLWPDISAGDCLVLLIDRNGDAQFYYNNRAIGSIGDSQFAGRFTAIWLHPNSSEPKLRQQLLGGGA